MWNLCHNSISGNISEELLFQKKLTTMILTASPYHWRGANLCPYHGKNCPWPPLLTIYVASGGLWLITSQLLSQVVTRQSYTARPIVMQPPDCLWAIFGALSGCTWSIVRASHLDLDMGTVRRVHSTFITEFPVRTHKSEVMLNLQDNTMEIGQILAGETGVS
jgi:hypothetical protein